MSGRAHSGLIGRSLPVLSLFTFALIMSSPSAAGAEVYGYLEARWLRIEGVSHEFPEYVTAERFRPTLVEELDSVKGVSVTATPEFHLFQIEDDPPDIHETDDYLTVERLYADVDAGPARIRLGRQAVNWGSALLWNPTDLFQEVFLTDYWSERKGVNAARVYVPMPHEFRFTAVAATGDTVFYHNRFGAKASLARWGADTSVVWMDDTVLDRLAWGLDVKGTAVVGYWVEAAAFAPKDTEIDGYEQAVAGVDYSFPVLGTLYIAGQYYYDGSGEAAPDGYDRAALMMGERTTLGMHYANLLAALSINTDLSVSVNGIYNLDDSTYLVTPYVTVSFSSLRVTGGANLYGGPEGGEWNPHPDQDPMETVPRAVYYTWARWYF